MLSCLDQLKVNSYINHFGKVINMEDIHVKPILFHKTGRDGQVVKIALYGIGHIKDERLNLAFDKGSIHFSQPLKEDRTVDNDYFSILVLH